MNYAPTPQNAAEKAVLSKNALIVCAIQETMLAAPAVKGRILLTYVRNSFIIKSIVEISKIIGRLLL